MTEQILAQIKLAELQSEAVRVQREKQAQRSLTSASKPARRRSRDYWPPARVERFPLSLVRWAGL
jgi:hypothetical protein